jgi:hypothetical protein
MRKILIALIICLPAFAFAQVASPDPKLEIIKQQRDQALDAVADVAVRAQAELGKLQAEAKAKEDYWAAYVAGLHQ